MLVHEDTHSFSLCSLFLSLQTTRRSYAEMHILHQNSREKEKRGVETRKEGKRKEKGTADSRSTSPLMMVTTDGVVTMDEGIAVINRHRQVEERNQHIVLFLLSVRRVFSLNIFIASLLFCRKKIGKDEGNTIESNSNSAIILVRSVIPSNIPVWSSDKQIILVYL